MERRQETRSAGRAAGGLMDLHTHSACSDGDRAPAALVESAAQSGVGLLALTDHDSVRGVPEAVAAGRRLGLPVVPGVEMSNEFPQELHILGLGGHRVGDLLNLAPIAAVLVDNIFHHSLINGGVPGQVGVACQALGTVHTLSLIHI